MTDRYAVIGNPIAHSQSPRLHRAFAQQTGQDLCYEAILATEENFECEVAKFSARGGRGMNVTVPFKSRAFALSEAVTDRATLAQAVNTLSLGGVVRGDNTDGIGLVRDLTTHCGLPLQGKRMLILGAGGATAGIIGPLLAEGAAEIIISNRTPAKASHLVQRFAGLGRCRAENFASLPSGFDLVINATASALSGVLPPVPTHVIQGAFVYDLMYGEKARLFLDWARGHGACETCDGLGMLVEQAAESFFIWRGIRPDTAPILAMMRDG